MCNKLFPKCIILWNFAHVYTPKMMKHCYNQGTKYFHHPQNIPHTICSLSFPMPPVQETTYLSVTLI